MPNLFFKIDIDAEVFKDDGKKIKESIETISTIVLNYKGFTDVEHNYDILIDKEEFVKDSEITISDKSPYNVKIKGIAKVKAKADLYQNILEDKNPKISLFQIHAEPFNILEIKVAEKSKKMECTVSQKKPSK
mgnify:FL=1